MLKVNLSDSRTLSFDLAEEEDWKRWSACQQDGGFQRRITAIGVYADGELHMLPLPARFERVAFAGEAIVRKGEMVGERVECQADDVKIALLVYGAFGNRPKLVRVDVTRIGRPRYVARHKPWPQSVDGRKRGRFVTGVEGDGLPNNLGRSCGRL